MNVKLTLSIGDQVIQEAKQYAKDNGKSLSSIVEEYLKSLTKSRKISKHEKMTAIVKELKGSVKIPEDFTSYKDILQDALIEKYIK